MLGYGDLWCRFGLAFGLRAGHELIAVRSWLTVADKASSAWWASDRRRRVRRPPRPDPASLPSACFRHSGKSSRRCATATMTLNVAFGHAGLHATSALMERATVMPASSSVVGDDLDQPAVVALRWPQFGDLTRTTPPAVLWAPKMLRCGGHIPIVAQGRSRARTMAPAPWVRVARWRTLGQNGHCRVAPHLRRTIDAGDFDGVGRLLGRASFGGPASGSTSGAENIAGLFCDATRRYPEHGNRPRTRHLVLNPIIDVDGDAATARSGAEALKPLFSLNLSNT